MKTRILKGLTFLFVLALIVACNTNQPESAGAAIDIEEIKKEIQAKEDAFAEIYNSGEMKRIGYYADDAVTFPQNNPALVGKEAIVAYLGEHLDSLNNDKISFKTLEVFPSNDGEQVVEIGYYTVFDADSSILNSGNYMALFVKQDGKYVSLRDMSTCDIPLE